MTNPCHKINYAEMEAAEETKEKYDSLLEFMKEYDSFCDEKQIGYNVSDIEYLVTFLEEKVYMQERELEEKEDIISNLESEVSTASEEGACSCCECS